MDDEICLIQNPTSILYLQLWFNVFLISFQLKSIDFDRFLFKRSKKTTLKSIKRSKKWNYIIKVDVFWLLQSLLIIFEINLISFDQIQNFQCISSRWNWFHLHDSDLDEKFGSKKSIKSQFDHDLSPNLSLSWFSCLSLKSRSTMRAQCLYVLMFIATENREYRLL